MTRAALFALLIASCIPEPVRAPPCAQWTRRCTPTGLPALCVAGEWVLDNGPNALACER